MRPCALLDVAALFDSTPAAPYDEVELPHRMNGSVRHTNGRPTREVSRHSKDRFAVINAFVDVSMQTVKPIDAAVWLVLWRDTKPNGVAKMSQKQIADAVGVDERTVRRAIDHLRGAGLVDVAKRGGIGRGASTYRVRGVAHQQ